jgi:hypothetical protein
LPHEVAGARTGGWHATDEARSQKFAALRRALGITDERILTVGYSDQLLAAADGHAERPV